MARLMERLQKVDNDPSPTDSVTTTTTNQPERNTITTSDLNNKDLIIDNNIGRTNRTNDNGKSRTIETAPKTFESKETHGLVRKSSGSLKLDKKPKSVKLHRHSSLGILPSTIAIGSGFYLDDLYDEEICRARREQVGKGSKTQPHNGPGILWPLQSGSCSNTPHTLRSEIFLHRQVHGNGQNTPTRGI